MNSEATLPKSGLRPGNDPSALARNAPARSLVSPLVRYGLSGLRRCWLAEHGRWSHKYHLDGRQTPNKSRPYSDLYYSLNVLLGLGRVRAGLVTEPYDVPVVFTELCRALPNYPVRNGAWGMALWVAAELGLDVPSIAVDRLLPIASDIVSAASWTAQDVGLTLSGATAQLGHDGSWQGFARALRDLLMTHFRGPGALFRDSGKGPRRHIATFASQVYVALALYQYGETTGDEAAVQAANGCASKLIALQGKLGEWPWFYLPSADRVVDLYEVYSVHQHGMGPALLHHAVRHGVPGAAVAIERGVEWLFGANELGVSMLVPSLQMTYRSQARQGLRARREARLLRAAVSLVTSNAQPQAKPALCLSEEMRSYEFGWLLWSFGDRTDYHALTHRAEFAAALRADS